LRGVAQAFEEVFSPFGSQTDGSAEALWQLVGNFKARCIDLEGKQFQDTASCCLQTQPQQQQQQQALTAPAAPARPAAAPQPQPAAGAPTADIDAAVNKERAAGLEREKKAVSAAVAVALAMMQAPVGQEVISANANVSAWALRVRRSR
jgi:hypothetical protein